MIANLSLRTDLRNANHHLWLNNGTWFICYTIHPDQVTKERVRRSLNTKSVEEARQRRDELFHRLAGGDGDVGAQNKLRAAGGRRMGFVVRRFDLAPRCRSRRDEARPF